MNTHPYLRAFLAGVFVPTIILPGLLLLFLIVHYAWQPQFPVERSLVFPMSLIPVTWGLWNVLWKASHTSTNLSVGAPGAILPVLLLPSGTVIGTASGIVHLGSTSATWFETIQIPYALIAAFFAAALAAYYLIWKYVVGFVNRTLGIA
jgi:hypothetical protein